MKSLLKVFEVTDAASFAQAAAFCTERASEDQGGPDAAREKLDAVRAIVEAVRTRGDDAVAEYTARFDGVELRPDQFELDKQAIDRAVADADRDLVAALERAHENIRQFHAKNLRQSWEETCEDGTLLGQRILPIETVGVYVPGGKAFYPSSVLMNIVPAKVAGTREIVMVSPPSYQGSIHPLVLAAARIAGATRIFRIGGAQAVAALAFGTKTVPAVLKITGPGNVYVTLAKRLISTVCDIDTEAGPSEIAVIADEKANPEHVAIELICQAEHDEDATATLITSSKKKLKEILQSIEDLLATLPRADMARTALTRRGAAFVVRSLDEAAALADVIAPEHLSIQVEVPMKVFDKIRNAGAVLLGGGTPVAVGDYYAGPNHILPTGRRARFASSLSVDDFRKTTNFMSYSRKRLRRQADDIMLLANAEGLPAHARAVELRR